MLLRRIPFSSLLIRLSTKAHPIDHITVVCSVTWPLNASEARGHLDKDLNAFVA